MGYGVFPFALEQDCIIAFSIEPQQKEIVIHHTNSKLYPSFTLPVDPNSKPKFINKYLEYIWAGYLAATLDKAPTNPPGLNLLVSGTLPVASGLSSSSSITVASGITSLFANNLHLHSNEPVEKFIARLIKHETLIATACG